MVMSTTVPIKVETLKAFADEARRIGEVENDLYTAEMIDIFKNIAVLTDAENTTFGSASSIGLVETGRYSYGQYKAPAVPTNEEYPYCVVYFSANILYAHYNKKPIVTDGTTTLKNAWLYFNSPITSSSYTTVYHEARVSYNSETKEYAATSWGDPKKDYQQYKALSTTYTVMWANHNICNRDTGAVVFAGGELVPEVVEGTIIAPVEREEYYRITGASLNKLATAIQNLTGSTDLLTPETMESLVIGATETE